MRSGAANREDASLRAPFRGSFMRFGRPLRTGSTERLTLGRACVRPAVQLARELTGRLGSLPDPPHARLLRMSVPEFPAPSS